MKRLFFTAVGIITLTLLAAGLTEATLALGHRGRLSDDKTIRTSPTPSATPTPVITPTPSPTPAPTPAPTPLVRTATTNSFVHMRAGASTSTAIVMDLNGGAVVTLGAYSDSQWQQVTYNGQNGYIFKSYLAY